MEEHSAGPSSSSVATASSLPADLPRVYIPSLARKIWTTAFCSLAILFSFFLLSAVIPSFAREYRLTDPQNIGPGCVMLMLVFGMLYLSYVAIYSIRGVLWGKLVWGADSIELDDARGHQVFRTSEIVGRRDVPSRSGRVVRLILTNPNLKNVKIAMNYVLPLDDDFKKWVDSLPDMDAIDKAKDKEKRRASGKLHWWED